MNQIIPVRWSSPWSSLVPAAQKTGPWKSLFDGKSIDAWRIFKTDNAPKMCDTPGAKDCWEIKDGVLQKDSHANDIASKEQFGDFELELEWKIGDASNSGVFYRGTDEFDQIYWSAPEYQLLDNLNAADNKKDNHLAGLGLRPLRGSEGRREARQRVEPDAHRREGEPRRALAQRQEGRVVRRRERRLGCGHQGASKFNRTVSELRQGAEGLSRHPGRSPRHARAA